MTIPLAPAGRTLETVRLAARRRFLLAAWFLALGTLLLAAAEAFLLLPSYIGGVTALILGALMQVLGLSAGAYGAVVLSRAFPLSESGLSARLSLIASLLVVLPVSAGVTAAYVLLTFPEPPFAAPTSLVVLPAIPFFWGPPSAIAAVGLVYAARELASERMAVVAGVGCGAVIAMAFSAGSGSLADPVGALRNARLAADLLVVAIGFVLIAAAFHFDAWAARSRHAP